jgi:Coenzyme PQQ synthesis protein D (PqqD)
MARRPYRASYSVTVDKNHDSDGQNGRGNHCKSPANRTDGRFRVSESQSNEMNVPSAGQLRPDDHVAGKIMDGELVAINLQTGLYYSSTGIGPVIWQLMEAGHTGASISGAIATHCGVDAGRVQSDVTAFLDRLLAENLVAPVDGAVASRDTPIIYSGEYVAPSLTSFNDMEQAFALDPPLRA